MTRWVDEVPHDGLIYYRFIFNADRILLASPQAVGEVLVQKSYDFMKPGFLRGGVAQILGEGILLAEGDEHKVSCIVQRRLQSIHSVSATTQKFEPGLRISSCQRPVPRFLGQVPPSRPSHNSGTPIAHKIRHRR